jgi:glycerol-3-phosphate dehydrogenase
MVPALDETRFIRAYCGIRPLVYSGNGDEDDREVSRGYSLVDHAREGVSNFVTITGGKLTTYRLMAEKTADLVCRKLGVAEPCRTRTEPLPDAEEARWTEPGLAAKKAILKSDPTDLMVCDCEMVPRTVVDALIETVLAQKDEVGMIDVAQRSRLGKGSCQGTFCSQRLIAHLYDREIYHGRAGMAEIKTFVQERWRGRQPVLWDTPMIQADLQEAIQCGLLGLELVDVERPRAEGSASPDEAPAEIPKRAAIREAETCPKR